MSGSSRSGPFWEAVEGRSPLPPAAATLGFELLEVDVDAGTIEVAFEATEAFTTPRGDVLEGFLAAMLHDTLGPALIATLEPGEFILTLDLQASFVWPAYPGRLVGRGRLVRREADKPTRRRDPPSRDDRGPCAYGQRGGPVVERTTSAGVIRALIGVVRPPSIRSRSASNAREPMVGRGWSTVVSETWWSAARYVLSYPTTEMSSGTRRPLFSSLSIAPAATRSLAAKIAVGSSWDRRSSSAARTPA